MLKRLEAMDVSVAVAASSLLDEPLCVSGTSFLSTKKLEASLPLASLSTSSRRLEAGGVRNHLVKHRAHALSALLIYS